MTAREVITWIQSLPGPVAGADIVEYNPCQGSQGIIASLCARLVKEGAARMIETQA